MKELPPVSEELVVFCDVDKTLIFEDDNDNRPQYITLNYYGTQKIYNISNKHIDFLKSLRHRGYYIVVMSANGKAWADEVVDKLGLRNIISETMTKPLKYIDDLDCKEWMGARIYLENE